MEILGQALVDMRDAPDAQVVLEIGLVRAVRPDLDSGSGSEALAERISALDRALSGAPAFPRPTARQESVAPAPAPAAAPDTAAAATAAGDGGERRGDAAGSRPSLGAVRRSKQAPAPAPVAPSVAVDDASSDGAVSDDAAPPAPIAPPSSGRAASTAGVDRDSLTEAWGDGILRALPARAKALYSAGRFVSVDDTGAHFALPNAAHRDRCVEMAPAVEAKLAEHFGTPVTLVLEVDDDAAGPPSGGAAPPRAPGPTDGGGGGGSSRRAVGGADPADDEAFDPSDYADQPAAADEGDQAQAAEARLLEAFPGASEVAG